jgi:hypothetical protein
MVRAGSRHWSMAASFPSIKIIADCSAASVFNVVNSYTKRSRIEAHRSELFLSFLSPKIKLHFDFLSAEVYVNAVFQA